MHATMRGPKGRLPNKKAPRGSQPGAERIVTSREPRQRPKENPNTPRRLNRLSMPTTGIALPKTSRQPSRVETSGGKVLANSPAGSTASAISGRETRPTAHTPGHGLLCTDATELQAQLQALGIDLDIDTVRERVRIAEERLARQRVSVRLGLGPAANSQTGSDSWSGVSAPRSPESAGLFHASRRMRKRPSTARARLEHGAASQVATKTRSGPGLGGDGDIELDIMEDDDGKESTSRCLPDDVLRSEYDASGEMTAEKLTSTQTAVDIIDGNAVSQSDNADQGAEPNVPGVLKSDNADQGAEPNVLGGLQTKKEWDTGSVWEWGNPNRNPCWETVQVPKLRLSQSPQSPTHDRVQVPKLGLSARCDAPSSPKAATSRSPKAATSRSARTSLHSSRSTLSRPFTPRSGSAFVGLSPRTNLREPMGIWACPNTPGPGAYHVAERTTQGGNLYANISGKRVYGRSSKFGNEPRLAPTPIERHLKSTPGPGAYRVRRPNEFGHKSIYPVQVWGVGPQFPPTAEFIEAIKVPGPKYDVVKRSEGGQHVTKGFSWGSTPKLALTPREIEWKKVPGPGHYEVGSTRQNRACHIGSGPLTPRFEMCYIDPKTPGPGGYDIDRTLTPRQAPRRPRSAFIAHADSPVVVKMKQQLEAIKATPGVGDYEPTNGTEINKSRPWGIDVRRCAGRSRPAPGDPIVEAVKVPSAQEYHPTDGRNIGEPASARSFTFPSASRYSLVVGY